VGAVLRLASREVRQPRSAGATTAAAQGTAAFGQLYREHFDGVYDFVTRIVRDHDLAGEVVQSTFTKAWGELRAGRELQHPKAWLYTVARNQALDELRQRRRLTDEPYIYAQPDPSRLSDPQAVAEDNEIVELVWSSAAALNPDEYSLLDLHVRHGFDAAELADALDLERGAVYTRLSRLRNSLEESVASTLLVRRGSEDCAELRAIIAEHDAGDSITPQLRRAVRAHVKECAVCREARRRAVSPVALFGALTPVVPLAGVREGILGTILPSGSHAATAGAAGGGAVATAARQAGKARYLLGGGGIAAAAAVVSIALSGAPGVHDPSSAESLDHTIGVASADNTVSMRWTPGKNAKGYSVVFSRNRSTEPPARENVTGTRYTSAPLDPGRWWFILRSHGRDGGWTDTLRVGPFVITAPVARSTGKTAPAVQRKHAVQRPRRKASSRHVAPAATPKTTDGQIIAGVRAPPSPRAHQRTKTRTKTKTKTPPRPLTPPHTVTKPPPAETPAATPSPPAQQPVTQNPPPPVDGDDDNESDDDCESDDDREHDDRHGQGHHDDGDHDDGERSRRQP
jgi:RNA polymerase sigma factor (sigma-70 family)